MWFFSWRFQLPPTPPPPLLEFSAQINHKITSSWKAEISLFDLVWRLCRLHSGLPLPLHPPGPISQWVLQPSASICAYYTNIISCILYKRYASTIARRIPLWGVAGWLQQHQQNKVLPKYIRLILKKSTKVSTYRFTLIRGSFIVHMYLYLYFCSCSCLKLNGVSVLNLEW